MYKKQTDGKAVVFYRLIFFMIIHFNMILVVYDKYNEIVNKFIYVKDHYKLFIIINQYNYFLCCFKSIKLKLSCVGGLFTASAYLCV